MSLRRFIRLTFVNIYGYTFLGVSSKRVFKGIFISVLMSMWKEILKSMFKPIVKNMVRAYSKIFLKTN